MATTLQHPNNFDWYKLLIAACVITTGVILFQLIPKCNSEVIEPLDDSIKDTIAAQKLRKDSIHEEVIYKDSIRIIYVTKWRELKVRIDTMPCPQALAEVITLTDSIIQVDSSEIASLKAEVFVADLIISNQDLVIKSDSVKIRKLKRQRNIAALIGTIGWGIAIVK